jgi:hypothetical protein
MSRKSKTGRESEDAAEVRPRYARAIDFLLQGRSVGEAAQAAGYSESYLSHLIHENPVFKAELNRRRSELTRAVQADIRELARELIAKIRRVMDSPRLTPGLVFQIGLSTIPKLWDILKADDGGVNALLMVSNDMETREALNMQEVRSGSSVKFELQKAESEL